ncbi:lamin-like protein isoform X2 [Nymphaea colorata]|nr:lamin-like protein isoform X2 [Nymphaea colorata]
MPRFGRERDDHRLKFEEVGDPLGHSQVLPQTTEREEAPMDLRPIWPFLLLSVAALILQNADFAVATDHIVGANHGWNSGVNFTQWAANQTFYVGDFISFRYPKTGQYNVFMVNQSGYDNCTTEGALGNWSSGKDFVELKEAKRYYFICGNGMCFNGMKVSVKVEKLPAASPPKGAANSKSGARSVISRWQTGGWVWLAVAASAALALAMPGLLV